VKKNNYVISIFILVQLIYKTRCKCKYSHLIHELQVFNRSFLL